MTTKTVRVPRRDAADNRLALLAAARGVLNRDPDASLETIAAEAGLSRRSVYGHFANRDELLRELVTIGSLRIAGALDGITHPEPVLRLALIASQLWREVADVRVMALLAVRGPLRVHTAAALAPLRAGVLDAIVAGQADGTIRTDIAAPRLAHLVEDSALAVLEEASEHPMDAVEGNGLAVRVVLGAIGLGWRDANTFIDIHGLDSFETSSSTAEAAS
jgi:AcrR family transcriptional regulator